MRLEQASVLVECSVIIRKQPPQEGIYRVMPVLLGCQRHRERKRIRIRMLLPFIHICEPESAVTVLIHLSYGSAIEECNQPDCFAAPRWKGAHDLIHGGSASMHQL